MLLGWFFRQANTLDCSNCIVKADPAYVGGCSGSAVIALNVLISAQTPHTNWGNY